MCLPSWTMAESMGQLWATRRGPLISVGHAPFKETQLLEPQYGWGATRKPRRVLKEADQALGTMSTFLGKIQVMVRPRSGVRNWIESRLGLGIRLELGSVQ